MKLLRLCIDNYGITNFHFEDDNLSFDKRRFETILDSIIKENMNIQWDTPNGLRADSLNYKLIEKMRQSGCMRIVLAIESGNQRVLDEVIKKKTKLKCMIDIVKYCKELKISAAAFYVIGFPGETINEMKDTTNLALKLYKDFDLFPILNVATPLYGTELYEICIRNKLLKGNPTFEELSVATQITGNPMISTPDFSLEDIRHVISEFNKSFLTERMRYSLKHPRHLFEELKHPIHIADQIKNAL